MTNSQLSTDVFIELHVPDFQKALDFYHILGFEVVWVNEEYLVMSRGKSILNFYRGTKEVYNQSYFKNWPKDTKGVSRNNLPIFHLIFTPSLNNSQSQNFQCRVDYTSNFAQSNCPNITQI